MANTWTALAQAVTFSTTTKVFLQLFNGGSRVLRVYRIWLINTQVAAVTGVVAPMLLARVTALATGTPTTVTPTPHDSTNSALDTVTCNTGATALTPTSVYRRFQYLTDEHAPGTAKVDTFLGIPRFALYWDGGYGDSNVDPIVLPPNNGLCLYTSGVASAAGSADAIFEFTDSAT
jgi:hypothetical protein